MKLKKIGLRLITICLLAVFTVSAFQLIRYGADMIQQENRYDELASIVEQAREETTPTVAAPEAVPTESVILAEYDLLHQVNPDLAGWLQIEGTEINYPVMQTPEEPDYYLYRNFDKEYNAHGCIYAEEHCDIFAPSDNITLYGHHMNDGSMFAGLDKYLDRNFWEAHKTIRFDSLTDHHSYEIFAVFKTSATEGEGFAYHLFTDAADSAEFDAFVENCKELAFYDTGITPEYGDKLLCLSTCEYTQSNGRLVVAAVRID